MVNEDYIREVAEWLFDSLDTTGRRPLKLDISTIPSYEDTIYTYDYEIKKSDYKKAKDLAIKAATDLPLYNAYDDVGAIVIELNDNHTIWEIGRNLKDGEELDGEAYSLLVNDACDTFKEKTGEDLMLLGRSGRHVCVKLTLDNALNFKKFQEIQQNLEKEVINSYLGLNEGLENLDESISETGLPFGYKAAINDYLKGFNSGRFNAKDFPWFEESREYVNKFIKNLIPIVKEDVKKALELTKTEVSYFEDKIKSLAGKKEDYTDEELYTLGKSKDIAHGLELNIMALEKALKSDGEKNVI